MDLLEQISRNLIKKLEKQQTTIKTKNVNNKQKYTYKRRIFRDPEGSLARLWKSIIYENMKSIK
jgi:hypothetical protein